MPFKQSVFWQFAIQKGGGYQVPQNQARARQTKGHSSLHELRLTYTLFLRASL